MTERVVTERTTRAGRRVLLLDRGSNDDGGGRWETICVDHGGVCSHETRWLAARFLSHPDEWCEDCMHGEGTLDGSKPSQLRTVCSWCSKVIAEGDDPTAPVTHGICDDCADNMRKEAAL